MSNKIKSCTPPLRFPEFHQAKEWSIHPISNFLQESKIEGSRGNTAKKITVKLWGKGVTKKNENYHGSIATQYFKRKSGQFIYSKLDFLNQAFGIIPEELDGFESTIDLPCFDFKDNIVPLFFLKYVMRPIFYKKNGEVADGGRKAKRIQQSIFLSFPIAVPALPEQQKIADCLSSLDELIEAHEQKLDALQQHKKGLMQRLFPAEGETTPRWRFPEFRHAGEWEKRVLKEHCHVITGGTPSRTKENYWDGNIPWISSRHISDMHTILGNEYISKEGLENSSTNIIPKNSTLLVTRVSVGKYTITSFDIAINQDITALIPYDINYKFLFFYSEILAKMIKNSAVGTGVVGVSQSFFDMISIYCPNSLEQQKIADCLFALDEHIKAQEKKIAALKEHKKGLMQQLFPSL